jgi:GT2 family glycosyltransferase/glycosyltransferase involved in cell wall biosynthesis
MRVNDDRQPDVSIVIPVFNKLAFTRQCLDRIWRNTSDAVSHEVIVVDNGSSDGTREYFEQSSQPPALRYQGNETNLGFAGGNNVGARLAVGRYLLFLNNDTLVQPKWLEDMVGLASADPTVGIVGIKQLFPYTSTIHHTGIVFTAQAGPQHLYPYADARWPHVNKQREYQAVNGACLLVRRELFEACGGFDEGYVNGYEDLDLCMAVRQRGFKVVCCTSSYIYHYGQISDGRTDDDDRNAARFSARWGSTLRVDESEYRHADLDDAQRVEATRRQASASRSGADALYFVDDLSRGTALSWAVADLVLALKRLGAPVHIADGTLTKTLDEATRRELAPLMRRDRHPDGVHIKWSHYWPQHLALDLTGRINLELFVINYTFGRPGAEPWDYWLQCLPQNHTHKLPLTTFCRDVLLTVGVPPTDCDVLPLGYSREIHAVPPSPRRPGPYRFLTVTNSHDLARYGTRALLDAYWEAFAPGDDVVLIVKDYGAAAGDTTLRELLRRVDGRAKVEYIDAFTSKADLIRLYRSCDAFVSAHRSEGFGMKILDALACGLPVITPRFGGPADLCTPETSFEVGYTLTPVADCFDTRSLRITNQPLWCEPHHDDLMRQLRVVAANPAAAARVGEAARRAVIDRFTWDASASRLLEIVEELRARQSRAVPAFTKPAATPTAESSSPYWLGCRVSVIIPTYNRRTSLVACLNALERQSILPSEFEAIVVDDGSTDDTESELTSHRFSFPVQYHRQSNQGPGAARNFGLTRARGELVLFIGDDIIADERLLEHHLLAHAVQPEPGAAVLGHIDWPPWLTPTPVMDYVCGEGGLQFWYYYIPNLPALDYRFFYTSNISLKRTFLEEAFAAGLRFDPCFRYAAFEDSELAYRLESRGLTIHYSRDALAYHDHWMNLESFARREYNVGRMAVVFYRKHPQMDDLMEVRWVGEWVDAVQRLRAQPELLAKVQALDAQTDRFLVSLEEALEGLLGLEAALAPAGGQRGLPRRVIRSALHRVLAIIFDTQRTRGKVQEWYGTVEDRDMVETAKVLMGCLRKLEFLGTDGNKLGRLGSGLSWVNREVRGLKAQGDALRHALDPAASHGARALLRRILLRAGAFRALRDADQRLQAALLRRERTRWLTGYYRVRTRLKRLL